MSDGEGSPPDGQESSDRVLQLKFRDEENSLTELNAAEVAEVLQGLVEFTSDFAKAGAFGDGPPPTVMVRPPEKGSFVLQAVLDWMGQNPEGAYSVSAGIGGTFVAAFNAATKQLRTEAKDFEELDGDRVKILWGDDTVDVVPTPIWVELSKRKHKRKRILRKMMAPLSDEADTLQISSVTETEDEGPQTVETTVATDDYRNASHEDPEVETSSKTFDAEAELRSIDFRPGAKWRVRTRRGTRTATVEDEKFLRQVRNGRALRETDIFNLRIREDRVTENGRTTTEWTILEVLGHRRGAGHDDDASESASA